MATQNAESLQFNPNSLSFMQFYTDAKNAFFGLTGTMMVGLDGENRTVIETFRIDSQELPIWIMVLGPEACTMFPDWMKRYEAYAEQEAMESGTCYSYRIGELYNQPDYKYYLVNTETNKIAEGFEYRDDAKGRINEMGYDPKTIKIYSTRFLMGKGINPNSNLNWNGI